MTHGEPIWTALKRGSCAAVAARNVADLSCLMSAGRLSSARAGPGPEARPAGRGEKPAAGRWMAAAAVPRAPAGFRAVQSRVSSQRTDGAGAAWLASRVMWLTLVPIMTVAWATGWPWLIACARGRGVTVTVTGVPGQAVTAPPVAATAAGPAVHALDTRPRTAPGLMTSACSRSRRRCRGGSRMRRSRRRVRLAGRRSPARRVRRRRW